jgi:3'-5' exonuclease
VEWVNYRQSHSDGLEYGDLDPRFLDRDVRHTDTVTVLAINPTTKEIRKGNFLRSNPQQAKEYARRQTQQRRRKIRTFVPPCLTHEQQNQLEEAWLSMEKGLAMGHTTIKADLETIIHLNLLCKQEWISQAAAKLRAISNDADVGSVLCSIRGLEPEISVMVKRLTSCLIQPPSSRMEPSGAMIRENGLKRAAPPGELLRRPCWRKSCELVEELRIDALEFEDSPYLSLPKASVWVSSSGSLDELVKAVRYVDLVCIDTEWRSSEHVATLQVAMGHTSWVLDLLETDRTYNMQCRSFIRDLFRTKIVLGFSLGHDLPKLNRYVGASLQMDTCLDLQMLWPGRQMPGLADCVREFSKKALSKAQQCSDWSRRPLSKEQLDYAGLDAVVLAYLLAEKARWQSRGRLD